MTPNEAPARLLAIAAHPDDIDFGLRRHDRPAAAAGTEVTYCVITDGDAGGFDPDGAPLRDPRDPADRTTRRRGGPGRLGRRLPGLPGRRADHHPWAAPRHRPRRSGRCVPTWRSSRPRSATSIACTPATPTTSPPARPPCRRSTPTPATPSPTPRCCSRRGPRGVGGAPDLDRRIPRARPLPRHHAGSRPARSRRCAPMRARPPTWTSRRGCGSGAARMPPTPDFPKDRGGGVPGAGHRLRRSRAQITPIRSCRAACS